MAGPSKLVEQVVYKIRLAVEGDFPAVFALAREFYATTDYSKLCPIDHESTRLHYSNLLNGGYILLAECDGKAVGMLGCYVTPFYLNNGLKVSTESMWYLSPEHRGGTLGRDLVVVAERMAVLAGCKWIVMSTLSTSPGSAAKAYEALGYSPAEKSFFKEL